MSHYNITTEAGTTLKTDSLLLNLKQIRQLWPEQYDSTIRDYTVTDRDGQEITGVESQIFVDERPSKWSGSATQSDNWDVWGVDADDHGTYSLYRSSESAGETIDFGCSATYVIEQLQTIADHEESYQDSLDPDDQDYTYYNDTQDAIDAIKVI